MSASYATKDGLLYRMTRDSEKRVLMYWARSGEPPILTNIRGVTEIGIVKSYDAWDLQNVEEALLQWLRDGRKGRRGGQG